MVSVRALVRAAVAAASSLAVAHAFAHGPQIQLTAESGQIVTRRYFEDGPYSAAPTPSPATRIYVLPAAAVSNVWLIKPSSAFPSGPGIAVGYGLTNPASHPFQPGSYSVSFTGGLLKWNGSAFADAGATQLKALKSAATTTTVDGGPSPPLAWNISQSSWDAEQEETHSGLAFRFLGDGSSETSGLVDGVYLASLRLSHGALTPSAPFYFVVPKGVSSSVAGAATHAWAASQGIAQNAIQAMMQIPEPTSATLAGAASIACLAMRRRIERRNAAE